MPTISRDGISIYFAESGEGPPLILAHSFFCSGEMWSRVLGSLSRRHRVINVDLRGHGRSGPIERRITIYDLLSDCVAVLDHLKIDSAVWCGLSIGGMIGLRAALVVPERVRALILLDTEAGAPPLLDRVQYSAMSAASRVVGIRPFLGTICRLMFGRTTRMHQAPLVSEWRQRFASAHLPSMRRCISALNRRDSLFDRLDEIAVPALIISGEEDAALPPRLSHRIHANIANSELDIIAKAGHLSALEQPEAVAGAMARFLQRLPAPAA